MSAVPTVIISRAGPGWAARDTDGVSVASHLYLSLLVYRLHRDGCHVRVQR